MKKFMVSFDVVSNSLSISDLSRILGSQPSPFSHSQGERRDSQRTWDCTTWKLDSGAGDNADLATHINDLMKEMERRELTQKLAQLPKDCIRWLSIGVKYTDATCTVVIEPAWTKFTTENHVLVEITTYPVSS